VTKVKRNAAVAAAAVVGAAAGALLARLRRRGRRAEPAEAADPRAEELRHKLAEARSASAEEDEFQAAGMGAETIVDEPPRAATSRTGAEGEPVDEFEAMRQRIHAEGRKAAEEMREGSEPDSA
jgi:hypothetical protein